MRHRARFLCLIALLGLLSACDRGGGTNTTLVMGSVSGVALAGPTCPVETEDEPCPDRPVEGATVRVETPEGDEVALTTTDREGRYSFDIPAGSYRIVAQPHEGLMGTPETVEVTLGAGVTLTVDLLYDTGIR
ncbi:MAG: carboxypeptidase-like regulatory domain-containing protein [Acidimicrobiia bacterium]